MGVSIYCGVFLIYFEIFLFVYEGAFLISVDTLLCIFDTFLPELLPEGR